MNENIRRSTMTTAGLTGEGTVSDPRDAVRSAAAAGRQVRTAPGRYAVTPVTDLAAVRAARFRGAQAILGARAGRAAQATAKAQDAARAQARALQKRAAAMLTNSIATGTAPHGADHLFGTATATGVTGTTGTTGATATGATGVTSGAAVTSVMGVIGAADGAHGPGQPTCSV
ncbi:hypothetical protein [Streptomyces arenae]|uniref:hypothetical protein n=1 Tax=Streptomyces arenae TaxID=29301 RepID=UPI002657D2F9|nr:hypothetical protein [Streptomyces arenae]MCG7206314.1 hypothetical protein [Streptomyces arenae]